MSARWLFTKKPPQAIWLLRKRPAGPRGPHGDLPRKAPWGKGGMTERHEKSPVLRPGFLNGAESIPTWSGLRDSNSLPSAWEADALPGELNPQGKLPYYCTPPPRKSQAPRRAKLQSPCSVTIEVRPRG